MSSFDAIDIGSIGSLVPDFSNEKVWSDWDPRSAEELSAAPMSLLNAFKENSIQVNSMLCFSLGNVALEGLNFIEKMEFDMDP